MSAPNPQKTIEHLALLLKEERKKRGLSLTEVGTRAGLHYVAVLRIENSERVPSIDTLLRISFALGLSLPRLLTRAIKMAESDDSGNECSTSGSL